jgi:hypothetical protein
LRFRRKVASLGAFALMLGTLTGVISVVQAGALVTGVPAARLYLPSSTQDVFTSGVSTKVTHMVTTFATGGVSVSTNTITVPTAGIYRVSASLAYESGGTTIPPGTYQAQVWVGSTQKRTWRFHSATNSIPVPNGSALLKLSATQKVSLHAFAVTSSGGPAGIGTGQSRGGTSNYLTVAWVGATLAPSISVHPSTEVVWGTRTRPNPHQITSLVTTNFAYGSMKLTGDTVVIPRTGIYEVSASLAYERTKATVPTGTYETWVRLKSGTSVRTVSQWATRSFTKAVVNPHGSMLLELAQTEKLSLWGWFANSLNYALTGVGATAPGQGASDNYLSVAWVSSLTGTPYAFASEPSNTKEWTIPSSTNRQITMKTKGFASGITESSGTTFTVPSTGVYEVSASLLYERGTSFCGKKACKLLTVPAGTYETQIWITGTQVRTWRMHNLSQYTQTTTLPSSVPQPTGATLLKLTAGQKVKVYGWQNSGSTAWVGFGGQTFNNFSLSWVTT